MSLISGNATFNSGSVNYSANSNVIVGASNFCGDAQNCGLISSGYFFDSSTNVGIISSTATFAGTAINSGTASVAIFSGNSVNCSSVTSCAVFIDTAINAGSVTYASFCGSGTNNGIVSQSGLFYGSAVNSGSVCGDAVFSNTSINNGTIQGDAIFSDTTVNSGTVQGNAEVAITATNSGSVVGNVTQYEHQYQYGFYWADDSSLTVDSTKMYTGQYAATLVINNNFSLGTDGQSGYTLVTTNANGIVATITVVDHGFSSDSYYYDNASLSNGDIVYTGQYTNSVAANVTFSITGYNVSTNGSGVAALTAITSNWYDDSSSYNRNIVNNGSTLYTEAGGIQAAQLSAGLTIDTNTNGNFGGDFTVEFFYKPDQLAGFPIGNLWPGAGGNSWAIGFPPDGSFYLSSATAGYGGGGAGTMNANVWNYTALVREDGQVSAYVDGNRVNVFGSAPSFTENSDIILNSVDYAYPAYGKIAMVRVSDTARYSGSSHTVPTSVFTDDANTLLLLKFGATNVPTPYAG